MGLSKNQKKMVATANYYNAVFSWFINNPWSE